MIFLSWASIISLSFLSTYSNQHVEEPWERSKLVAITSFSGLEDYYIQLRKQKSEPPVSVDSESLHSVLTSRQQQFQESPPHVYHDDISAISLSSVATEQWRASIKKEICARVFHSDFYESRQEEWMDVDIPVIYKELRKKNRDLFKEIFPRNLIRRGLKFMMCANWLHHPKQKLNHRQYVNPVQNLSVSSVRGGGRLIGTEAVFVCPVRKRNSQREIKPYYVSEVYNVNAAYRNPKAPFIVGRFIFHRNAEQQLVIDALAEEPATVAEQGIMAQMRYAEMKIRVAYKPPAVDEPGHYDPLRRLTANEKIRLCASIFSSTPFVTGQVKYLPTAYDTVAEANSELKTVWFTDREALEVVQQKRFNEWTVVCKPSHRGSELVAFSSYYVSRADGFNRIFVHVTSPSKNKYLFAEYYFTNVSVVAI